MSFPNGFPTMFFFVILAGLAFVMLVKTKEIPREILSYNILFSERKKKQILGKFDWKNTKWKLNGLIHRFHSIICLFWFSKYREHYMQWLQCEIIYAFHCHSIGIIMMIIIIRHWRCTITIRMNAAHFKIRSKRTF